MDCRQMTMTMTNHNTMDKDAPTNDDHASARLISRQSTQSPIDRYLALVDYHIYIAMSSESDMERDRRG